MNNIGILEQFIDEYYASYPDEKECVAIYPEQIEALENLIEENKELKEERKLAYNLGYRNGCNDTSKFNDKEFIRKSKVKEKIEDYDKMIKATYSDITSSGDYRRNVCFEIRKVLQELLEGK